MLLRINGIECKIELKNRKKTYFYLNFAVRATAARYNQPTKRHIGIKQFVSFVYANGVKREKNPLGSGGFCVSGRIVFEYHTHACCMHTFTSRKIHTSKYMHMRKCSPNRPTHMNTNGECVYVQEWICSSAIWLLATETYCAWLTYIFNN